MEKLDRLGISGAAKMIHGPVKMIPQSFRTKITEGGQRIKQAVKPEPSPWQRGFEMVGTLAILILLTRKARGPKKV